MTRSQRYISGTEANQLPDGSAVLVHANSDNERIKRPHSAQVKARGDYWVGMSVTNNRLNPDWTYEVLWEKPGVPAGKTRQ